MQGQIVSHYRILENLGGGGMGVVYKAEDTRLNRLVALKFLAPDLTRDEEAKQRFVQEAQAASALDHPNICAIYEIDTTPDGRMFLAMGFYEGETLKKRIERGAVPLEEALDLAMQVARGLGKAHDAGIVHRDIKPANLIVTNDGTVKIIDFGIAKLSGQTSLTRTGVTLGTVSYMAPEQLRGDTVDHRADLWALGVTFCQILTGELPFRSDQEAGVISAILTDAPRNLGKLPPNAPPQLQQILVRALDKFPGARYASAAEFHKDLTACRQTLATPATGLRAGRTWGALRRPRTLVAAALAIVAVGGASMWAWSRGADARWARHQAIPEIRRLIAENRYVPAFELATRAEHAIGGDAALAALWPQLSDVVSFETTPPGAEILFKEYADANASWMSLGRSPVRNARMPQGVFRLLVKKEGYEDQETMAQITPILPTARQLTLRPQATAVPGMVSVQGGPLDLGFVVLRGTFEPIDAPRFLIDRYEVTNEQFKTFVDGGGYQTNGLWTMPFKNRRAMSPAAAIAQFRDATGRPGPSTWAVGTFPDGQGKHPVSGVSWYEAAAYCASAGKSLPTIYHWGAAASVNLAQFITALSNFGGKGPVSVGTTRGLSQSGAYDMAGNVKEWVYNASGDDRYLLGGAWNDPAYKFFEPETRPPFDRSAANGFRCAKFDDKSPVPEALTHDLPLSRRDYAQERPATDALFAAYRDQYLYDPKALNATVESVDNRLEHARKEKITFDAAYEGERITAYLFLPKSGVPPYETVVYFPGAFGFFRPSSADLEPEQSVLDYLSTSGRAWMYTVYEGTFERNKGELTSTYYARADRIFRNYTIRWVQDFMRSVDYLETRKEIDTKKLAYLGASWGGQMGAIIPAVEPRLRASVLIMGGLPMQRALPEVDPVNFVRHVRIPVLMLSGTYDYVFPVEASQRPLFNLLGTPSADKRYVTYDGVGHDLPILKRNEMIRETLAWLDKYLGPVK